MKSIKEKADEYARDYLFNPEPQRAPNVHFEAGANYVLDAIEDILTNPRRYVNPDKSVEEGMVDDIIKCIGQLKKSNQ